MLAVSANIPTAVGTKNWEGVTPTCENLTLRVNAGTSHLRIPTAYTGPMMALLCPSQNVRIRLQPRSDGTGERANSDALTTVTTAWCTDRINLECECQKASRVFKNYVYQFNHQAARALWANATTLDFTALHDNYDIYVDFQTPPQMDVLLTFTRANIEMTANIAGVFTSWPFLTY